MRRRTTRGRKPLATQVGGYNYDNWDALMSLLNHLVVVSTYNGMDEFPMMYLMGVLEYPYESPDKRLTDFYVDSTYGTVYFSEDDVDRIEPVTKSHEFSHLREFSGEDGKLYAIYLKQNVL